MIIYIYEVDDFFGEICKVANIGLEGAYKPL